MQFLYSITLIPVFLISAAHSSVKAKYMLFSSIARSCQMHTPEIASAFQPLIKSFLLRTCAIKRSSIMNHLTSLRLAFIILRTFSRFLVSFHQKKVAFSPPFNPLFLLLLYISLPRLLCFFHTYDSTSLLLVFPKGF